MALAKSNTTDEARFILEHNVYDQNFGGFYSGIVNLQSIRNLYITNETYQNNEFNYREAMQTYGTLAHDPNLGSYGNYIIGEYFYSDGNSLLSNNGEDQMQQYTMSYILKISSSIYVYSSEITFDNNAFYETNTNLQTQYLCTSGIYISGCQGEVYLNSYTFQNYQGMDVPHIQALMATTK